MTLHLAPNTPWILLVLALVALAALSAWVYRFAIPPLPAWARRLLPALRATALALLLLLLAQPVLERALAGGASMIVLVDRSLSMGLPVKAGDQPRSAAADRIVRDIERSLRGRARVTVLPFASRLGADSTGVGSTAATGIGDALATLATSPEGETATGVVVVSDGVSNRGRDPVEVARQLGIPVHGVLVGASSDPDRAVTSIDASASAQVGRATPVRVHVSSREPRGTAIGVTLEEGGRPLARTTVVSPGPGAETIAELRVTPQRPGLAVWTARVDSTAGELTARNNARQVAVPVSPGRLGVMIVTSGLNWDVAFLRRALAGDSALALATWVRERDGWRVLETRRGGTPDEAALRGKAVLILDSTAPQEIGAAFDAAVARFVERGGGVLTVGGPAPGLLRSRGGRFGSLVGINAGAGVPARAALPQPAPEARDLLSWDDDPARGERAWRDAAPLGDVVPLAPAAGDRVLVRGAGNGPALLVLRRAGRGQALLVNGSGVWRWSLSGSDELAAERGRRLWRALVHTLAEPVQGEPLRVTPERWIAPRGEPMRLIATLQDDQFRPQTGAAVEAQVTDQRGRSRVVRFPPAGAGSYEATLADLPPGNYRVSASASRGGRVLGRSTTEFAVDRWSFEEARGYPDSAALAALTTSSGGSLTMAGRTTGWARTLASGGVHRTRTTSVRLWESPWVFTVIVCALSLEWAWRRRRGLP